MHKMEKQNNLVIRHAVVIGENQTLRDLIRNSSTRPTTERYGVTMELTVGGPDESTPFLIGYAFFPHTDEDSNEDSRKILSSHENVTREHDAARASGKMLAHALEGRLGDTPEEQAIFSLLTGMTGMTGMFGEDEDENS